MIVQYVKGETEEMKIDVSRAKDFIISIKNGTPHIIFSESNDTYIYIKELKLKKIEENPLILKQNKNDIELIQDSKESFSSFETSFNLSVPKNLNIKIKSGNMDFSGELKTKNFHVSSGLLNISSFTIESDGEIKISGGNVSIDVKVVSCSNVNIDGGNLSGVLEAPNCAKITGVPQWSLLKIIRR
jgi:hypothetical protein